MAFKMFAAWQENRQEQLSQLKELDYAIFCLDHESFMFGYLKVFVVPFTKQLKWIMSAVAFSQWMCFILWLYFIVLLSVRSARI